MQGSTEEGGAGGGGAGSFGLTTLIGFAISCSGGPIALATLYLVQTAAVPPRVFGLVIVCGVLLFLAPLSIWLAYSREIASSGGLYAFVREASAPWAATVHGLLWSFSYLLYLPFTVTDIVYYLLPAMTPVAPPLQRTLEVGLPLVLSAIVVLGRRAAVALVSGFAAFQIAAVALFVIPLLTHAARSASGWAAGAQPSPLAAGAGGVSLLFVCSSLVLYLGGEAQGGGRTVRRALVIAFGVVGLLSIVSGFAIAQWLRLPVLRSAFPGYLLSRQTAGELAALLVALTTLGSLAGLIVAEYLALIRLWGAMFRIRWRLSAWWIALFFVAADAVSLLDPFKFYEDTIVPSLAALFLSQLFVFVVFARRLRARGRMRPLGWVALVVACAWALYGLYQAVAPSPAY